MDLNRTDKAIIKRILKGTEKNHCPQFAGAIPFRMRYADEQMYAFTDSQRIVVCDNPGDFPVLDGSQARTIQTIFDSFESYKCDVYDAYLEDVKASKEKRKAEKSKVPYIINTDKGKVCLDHDFLIDAIRFTESEGIYINQNKGYSEGTKCYLNPVFLDNGDEGKYLRMAMVFPVNWNPGKAKKD